MWYEIFKSCYLIFILGVYISSNKKVQEKTFCDTIKNIGNVIKL